MEYFMKHVCFIRLFIICCFTASLSIAGDQAPSPIPASGEVSKPATATSAKAVTNRPSAWAQPLQMEGVPNLFKINDSLYRSAQPTAEGMKKIKEFGIKTVINLRSFHTDTDELKNLGLRSEHIYMKAWHAEIKDAVRFIQIVTNTNNQPVLFHCQHGADRTGTMCAIYRIVIQGWSKENAVNEMTNGGYGFHEIWENLPEWLDKLDIEALKKEAGLPAGSK
jgi:protein tyrosine phosphatase (PTP) superfamily phosphohydrolase (DUF442 family)